MKRLDGPVRKQMQGTIDKIISGDPTVWAQTHPLGMALKGWNATKGSRGHRVVHQPNDQGGIHIGYVGLHEYDKAIQRLTSRQWPTEHVRLDDLPVQDERDPKREGSDVHPFQISHYDDPKKFRHGWGIGPETTFSLRQVPLEHIISGKDCPSGVHCADCYDKRHLDRPGGCGDNMSEGDFNDAHYVRRLAQTPEKLPALWSVSSDPEEIMGGGHRTAAWREAGWTHAPVWLPDEHRKEAGANGDLPDLDFQHVPGSDYHRLIAYTPEGRQVGKITWHHKPDEPVHGEIGAVRVRDDYQRRGIASELLRRARQIEPTVRHSESLSDEGRAWSEKTAGANGDLPDLTFKHYAPGERPVGYSTKLRKMLYSRDHHVEAYAEHPETGQPVMVGHAQYSLWDSPRRGPRASVGMMTTNPAWRRRGINSAVIDEIRRTHPDHSIGYDFLSPDGAAFVKGQTGRDVTPAVGPLESQAAVRNVSDTASDGDGITDGMMVAIVPPASLVEDLAIDEGESPEQLHITLAYLGQTKEYSEAQLEALHEVVESWADGQAKFTATVQGVGTFLPADEDGQHVLWASVDAPGLHRLHSSLVDYLKGHGYEPREDHSFTPHVTLAYGKHHFRFVPKVKRVDFKVAEVWVCVGGRWESVPLLG